MGGARAAPPMTEWGGATRGPEARRNRGKAAAVRASDSPGRLDRANALAGGGLRPPACTSSGRSSGARGARAWATRSPRSRRSLTPPPWSYRQNDAEDLSRFAGAKEAGRVRVLIELKKAAGLVLESTIESFEVFSIELRSPDAATVATRERWRYQDRALAPGTSPGPAFVAHMEMRYEVAREDGRWKVQAVRTL